MNVFPPLNTIRKSFFFKVAGLLAPFLDVTSSLCNMRRLAGCFLVRKTTKHATLFFLCICQKSIWKARKTSVTWSILQRNLLNYRPQLTSSKIQQWCFARKFRKVLFAGIKDKKTLTAIMKGNLRFR